MDILTPGHIILVLVGALLIFGPKRLPDIGKSLGKGIREFKGALNHIADDEPAPSSTPAPAPPPAPAWPTAQAAVPPVDVPPVPPAATPHVPVLGEEEGGDRGERFWSVDPLDGTTNVMIGFPIVAVSVALVQEGRPVVGSVRGPLLGLAFSAARGRGAWSGADRLRVSGRTPERAIVATGFPFRQRDHRPRHAAAFSRVLAGVEDVRRAGAAALDLAWVAAGVFDGYFELDMMVWDLAAGRPCTPLCDTARRSQPRPTARTAGVS